MTPDEKATEWLTTPRNLALMRQCANRHCIGMEDDGIQETQIAILQAFRTGKVPEDQKGADAYLRGIVFRQTKTIGLGSRMTSSEKAPMGHVEILKRNSGRTIALESLLNVGDEVERDAPKLPLYLEDGYEHVEQELSIRKALVDAPEEVRIEAERALADEPVAKGGWWGRECVEVLAEAGISLERQKPPSKGIFWDKQDRKWSVKVRHNATLYHGGQHRTLAAAEASIAELRASLPPKVRKGTNVRKPELVAA